MINVDTAKDGNQVRLSIDGQCSLSLPLTEFSCLIGELQRFTTSGASAQSYSIEEGKVETAVDHDQFNSIPDNAMLGVPAQIRALQSSEQFDEWGQMILYWTELLQQERNRRGIK